jgi:hypothetical protein
MSTDTDPVNLASSRPHLAGDRRSFDLHSVVVSYATGPDRCTIYPRRESARDRTTSWLSADLDAFVGLEEMR